MVLSSSASTAASLAHLTSSHRFSTLTSHEHSPACYSEVLTIGLRCRCCSQPYHLSSSHKNHSLRCEPSATFPAPRPKSSTFLSAHRARRKGHAGSHSAAVLHLGPHLTSVALIKHPDQWNIGRKCFIWITVSLQSVIAGRHRS